MAVPWITITHTGSDSALQVHPEVLKSLLINKSRKSRPQIVSFFGKREKSFILKGLLDANSGYPPLPHGQVHLWTDPSNAWSETPFIFVDCELCVPNSSQVKSPVSYLTPEVSKGLAWLNFGDHVEACAAFTANVLYPLSSLAYFFATDLGGLANVARMVVRHLTAYTGLQTLRPHLTVIVSDPTEDTATFMRFVKEAAKTILSPEIDVAGLIERSFSDVQILFLGTFNRSSRSVKLRDHMVPVVSLQKRHRDEDKLSFNFNHTEAFLTSLIGKFCDEPTEPFSFIAVSRSAGFAVDEFGSHLEELLSLAPSEAWLWHFIAPLVGASILLAAYPRGAHYFTAPRIFREIYRKRCAAALEHYTIHIIVRDKFLDATQTELERMTDQLSDSSAVEIYRKRISTLRPHIAQLRSNRTCLTCLHRMPEKILCCEHSICETCLQVFGERSTDDRHCYTLGNCPLCGEEQPERVFRLVPPTAGIRLLSLDGGGVRGVIAMTFLLNMEKSLSGFGCPIWDFFDLICGTSAGGIIALGIGSIQWSAEQCLQKFNSLARNIFKRRSTSSSLFARAQELLRSYVEDGQYNQSAIDMSFGEAGSGKLFSHAAAHVKIAVTSTMAKGTRACLFTNYNGRRRSNSSAPIGYDVIRAANSKLDVTISDAAKCTSAAPWYFKPHTMPDLGTYQDGGLQHNMPMDLAFWEKNHIWPEKEGLDFGISLGTGAREPLFFRGGPQSPVKDGCALRVFNAFLERIDGQKEWWRFYNSLPVAMRKRFHRLNISIAGKEPTIDDTSSIPSLELATQQYIDEQPHEFSAALESLYASIFYFELDSAPTYVDGRYHCNGTILCRLGLDQQGRAFLREWLTKSTSYFLIDGRPVPCCREASAETGPFKCTVHFSVGDLDESLSISIRGVTYVSKLISGFPQSVSDVMAAQMIDAPFGRVNHWIAADLSWLTTKRKLSVSTFIVAKRTGPPVAR